jgi:hypothetical protein
MLHGESHDNTFCMVCHWPAQHCSIDVLASLCSCCEGEIVLVLFIAHCTWQQPTS